MAKKKNTDKSTEVREADAGADVGAEVEATAVAETEAAGDETIVEAATPAYVADETSFLVAEVQTFLSKRGELAERLAREIEATERRLEELRRTAALLSPAIAAATPEPAKPEKKTKKPAVKKAEKKERKLDFAEAGDGATASDADGPASPPANEELVA